MKVLQDIGLVLVVTLTVVALVYAIRTLRRLDVMIKSVHIPEARNEDTSTPQEATNNGERVRPGETNE